jgi:thiamine-phosphate diphosphorylase
MRPLPRLHAITNAAVLADPDLGIRAAAIAAAGSAVALHARDRTMETAGLARVAQRFIALARPPEAAVFVSGRPDLARAVGAHGVQLSGSDLAVSDARRVFSDGWIGRSVHSAAEARIAAGEGADLVLLGNIYETATHPGRPGIGLEPLRETVKLGIPVVAIGGVTPERAPEVRDAGAWGIAVIRAVWEVADPYAAAVALLEPWSNLE